MGKKTDAISMVKQSLFIVALFLTSSSVIANDGVVIKLKNGDEIGFGFSSKPRIEMGTELRINTVVGTSVSYDFADVCNVTFGNISSTGIGNTYNSQTCDVVFRLLDGILAIDGLPKGESVNIYNLSGQMLATSTQSVDGATLRLTLTDHKILIVRTSTGISYKVFNK